jgi:hypothetical protein
MPETTITATGVGWFVSRTGNPLISCVSPVDHPGGDGVALCASPPPCMKYSGEVRPNSARSMPADLKLTSCQPCCTVEITFEEGETHRVRVRYVEVPDHFTTFAFPATRLPMPGGTLPTVVAKRMEACLG